MTRAGLAIVALSAVMTASAQADIPLNDDEVKCVVALNKRDTKVAAAQGKQNRYCVNQAGKGKIPAEDACLEADAKGKVDAARTKTSESFTELCADVPELGPSNATTRERRLRGSDARAGARSLR